MPTKWEIDKRDLQFAYVLGHAHGRRSMPNAFDLYKRRRKRGERSSRIARKLINKTPYTNDTQPIRNTVHLRRTGLQPERQPYRRQPPRRDPDTGQGIITDVRLKRYLRDQLLDDGFDIYVKSSMEMHGRVQLSRWMCSKISTT